MIQNGAVPVFLDNDPLTGNIDVSGLEEAFVPGKTKAVMCAHTLGNPFDLNAVLAFCERHDLWLIEDNCDALGSTYTRSTHRKGTRNASYRNMGRSFDPIFLSATSSHSRRRRRDQYRQENDAQGLDRELPRLGTGLLVRQRKRKHLWKTI